MSNRAIAKTCSQLLTVGCGLSLYAAILLPSGPRKRDSWEFLCWSLLVVSALMMFGAVYAQVWLWRHPHHPGTCHSCGYSLTGNVSGVCPECGTPVSVVGDPSHSAR